MRSVELRLVMPFYLKMMGVGALSNSDDLWSRLVRRGSRASLAEVRWMLDQGNWRPVVMGAWFSLKFTDAQVEDALEAAIAGCRGTLTAPPLATAAVTVLGQRASPLLIDYINRDVHEEYGSAQFVAAAVESLGSTSPTPSNDEARSDFDAMNAIARRLRAALLA